MFDFLYDFINSIIDGLIAVFDFIAFLVRSIIETVAIGIESIGVVTYYTGFLPSILATTIIAIITLSLIFKIKG